MRFTSIVWFRLVAKAGTARVAMYVNLQPFLGAMFAVVLLSERLSALEVFGGAAIGASIALARWRRPLTAPAE
jgi:drug/metabolite transporter (DMT)-like permease